MGVNIRFTEAEKYITELSKIFKECCNLQDNANRSYNHAIESWNDKVFRITGEGLKKTGETIMNVQNELSKSIENLNKFCCSLSTGYAERAWDGRFIRSEISVKVKLGDNMPREDEIKGTTIDGIKNFEKALKEYNESIEANVKKIQSAHQQVGAFWRDSQYAKTTEKINEFVRMSNVQIQALTNLQAWITKKRIQFEETLRIYEAGLNKNN